MIHRYLAVALLGFAMTIMSSAESYAMYDPGLGRFCSRDPIGFADGESLYGAYFSLNTVDPSGLCKCCCCVESLRIGNVTKVNRQYTFGHSFDVNIILKYPPSNDGNESDCTLKWEEKTNRSSPGNPAPNVWVDMFALWGRPGVTETFEPWLNRKKRCPSLFAPVTITDVPEMGKAQYKRILDIRITVVSAPNCRCQFASKTVEARQILDTDNKENIVTQTFQYGVESSQR
jgi:hypothetical protein